MPFLVGQFAVEAGTVGIGYYNKAKSYGELWTEEQQRIRTTGVVTKCRRRPREWRSAGPHIYNCEETVRMQYMLTKDDACMTDFSSAPRHSIRGRYGICKMSDA